MSITPATQVARADTALSGAFEEKLLMSDLQSGKYYELEGTAARIWELLETPGTIADLTATIASDYEIAPEECEGDIIEFVQALSDQGLVELS